MKLILLGMAAMSLSFSVSAARLFYPKHLSLSQKSLSPDLDLGNVLGQLGLPLTESELRLLDVKESILATHYTYQQTHNGLDVESGQLSFSISAAQEIVQVYDATLSFRKGPKTQLPLLSQSRALQSAWEHLKVDGEMLQSPEIKLQYSAQLVLSYRVRVATSSPFGYHDLVVNAINGKILSVDNEALPRFKKEVATPPRQVGPLTSLDQALSALSAQNVQKMLSLPVNLVNGSAQVFDPNPVVTLGKSGLEDNSPATEFNSAYETQTLNEISLVNGVYSLSGTKVSLADFESPRQAPVTSASGVWDFERGQDGFTDAMTYLHLDRSIRYLESLGFTNGKKIFSAPMIVDANGVNGDDNSHYIPSSRKLAFGHGCVDDNEDADVILHELGHAIQHHINSMWMGGDTGAMGEGFGDYWASSYSLSRPHGEDTHPEWAFKWDGHNKCWPGRVLNARIDYVAGRSYQAHQRIGSNYSDELWSAPLYKSYLELRKMNVPREFIDRIIIEAHFGLGSGLTMPQMAQSIVKTAQSLYPGKKYDEVYLKYFKEQKIL